MRFKYGIALSSWGHKCWLVGLNIECFEICVTKKKAIVSLVLAAIASFFLFDFSNAAYFHYALIDTAMKFSSIS